MPKSTVTFDFGIYCHFAHPRGWWGGVGWGEVMWGGWGWGGVAWRGVELGRVRSGRVGSTRVRWGRVWRVAALEENNLSAFMGADATRQPGDLKDLMLHETAVAWLDDRLTVTTQIRAEPHQEWNPFP